MKKFYLLFFAIAVLAVSCKTEKSYSEFQTRQLQPTVTANVTPMAADLNVSADRIVYETEYDKTKNESISSSKAKQYAIAEVLSKYKADVLVAPLVTVKENNSVIRVTVCGYPATYKNFRKATVQDIESVHKTKSRRR
jgi:chloramphenicol O-acetyltransferase